VRKLFSLVLTMMLALTLVTGLQASAAAAAEPATCGAIVADSEPGHAPGDSDEVPGDSDKATPHHHSAVHSHDVGVPAKHLAATPISGTSMPSGIAAGPSLPSILTARDLRPPIA